MASMENFIGCVVKVDCGLLGTFEGRVSTVDAATLNLEDVFHNGQNVQVGDVSIRAEDIQGLDIVRDQLAEQNKKISQQLEDESSSTKSPGGAKQVRGRKSTSSVDRHTPKKMTQRDQECFNEATEASKIPDFDFEKNLALFDKKAVFEELESSGAVSRLKKYKPPERKLRPDESVLEQEPVSLRQISVPAEHRGREFFTDDGITVPSVSQELAHKLLDTSEKMGLSRDQRIENAGLCACQMSLQLLGGGNRINPNNTHQIPNVVVMAGPHSQGLQGICTARHLANHNVHVTLFIPKKTQELIPQLALFMHTGGNLVASVRDLPKQPVDLVIDTLVGNGRQDIIEQMHHAAQWANQNRAPVLVIDPCAHSASTGIEVKWSIALGLPLASTPSAGTLYLADVGIPKGVFAAVGITYVSPFADKFVIRLSP